MAKNRHAQILGRKGGKKKSERKARAARLNGLLGGPKKYEVRETFVAPGVFESAPEGIRELTYESFDEAPHDPRRCTKYRCQDCKSLGHRDRNRGLL